MDFVSNLAKYSRAGRGIVLALTLIGTNALLCGASAQQGSEAEPSRKEGESTAAASALGTSPIPGNLPAESAIPIAPPIQKAPSIPSTDPPSGAPSAVTPATSAPAPQASVNPESPPTNGAPPGQLAAAEAHLIASNLQTDLAIANSLSLAGWEGLPPHALNKSRDALVGHDGNPPSEPVGVSPVLLMEFGCTDVVTRRFRRGNRFCVVQIYRFAKSNGAYGAYTIFREGSSTVVLRGQASSEDDTCISFWKGNVLAKLTTTTEDDEEAKDALGKLADQLVGKIEETASTPLVIKALPSFEKIGGSEKYFMGAEGAHRYINVPFIETLQINQSEGAGHADYQFAAPMAERLGLLVVDYKSSAQARTVFQAYVDNIVSMSNKVLQRSATEALCKVSDSFLLCTNSGRRVYVVSGARRRFAPAVLARQFK